MKSPEGSNPSGDWKRMANQSFGSDRLKATRPLGMGDLAVPQTPSTGAEKLAPRRKAVNQLPGGR